MHNLQAANETIERTVQTSTPVLSVVIPVRNDPENLRLCLDALAKSTFENFEVIVVDDASTDQSGEVAEERGAQVLRLPNQSGPARARNHGAALAQGEYVFFVDADVCVKPETVSQVVDVFQANPTIDALFGSYDHSPSALNIISQYKNLFHHYVHQNSSEQASTFWAGCGAIKRSVFEAMSGFDTSYKRPCIEDIELGVRMFNAGHRIALRREIQVTHRKKWTLWSMIRTDVRDRGIPWTELMLQAGSMPNDLNLTTSQRVSAILSYVLLGLLIAAACFWHILLALPFLGVLSMLMLDYWSVKRRVPTVVRVSAVLAMLGFVFLMCVQFRVWGMVGLSVLLGIVLINVRFYAFFARERHPLFAALITPLHILYYIYSGVALSIGIWRHYWMSKRWAQSNGQPQSIVPTKK